jgi:VPDSG-CTERM motif/Carbohydrate binding domain
MKTLMLAAIRCSLMFTAVAALSIAYPAKANLITNGGFETGDFTGWTLTGGSGTTVQGTLFGISPHSGNFQAVPSASPPPHSVSLAQTLATTPGATYTVDFWVATLGSASTMSVEWGGTTVFSHLFPSDSSYTEVTFNVTASTASTDLAFIFGGIFNLWFFDDVSVNPTAVGVPDGGTTVSLLGFALLGLAALRRKLGYAQR